MNHPALQEKGVISNGILKQQNSIAKFASGNCLATDISLLNELNKLKKETRIATDCPLQDKFATDNPLQNK